VGLITGSSHLHLAVVRAEEARTARGAWGAYRGAPLPHLAMAEGGQSSTGAALQWMGRLFGGEKARAVL
jgi:ribulose kinase